MRYLSYILLLVVLGFSVFLYRQMEDIKSRVKSVDGRLSKIENLIFPPEPPPQQEALEVEVGDSPVLGKKDAKVNIVVFSNFQCPYCSRADSALRELLKDDELKEKVNIAFKHFPFKHHTMARPASKATLAAKEQGKFWEMAEIIFANQSDLSEENFIKWAKEAGLDVEKFEKDLKEHDAAYDKIIDKDIEQGNEKAKLEGTPWILVNGWILDEAVSPDSIKKIIKDKNL